MEDEKYRDRILDGTKSSKMKIKVCVSRSPVRSETSRRKIFKEKKPTPYKAPRPVVIPTLKERLWFGHTFFTKGDVVSVVDEHQNVYYAQIRGLLQDQYDKSFCVITWLIPTTASTKGRFDPETYIIGPEEETPRELDGMEFVCHAPSTYFQYRDPYVLPEKPHSGFIMTKRGYKVVQLPYVEHSSDSE